MSINDKIKFIENIKHRFKRTISWNKYRSEITTHRKKIQHLGTLVDCLYFSFRNGNNDPMRDTFNKYYTPLVEIKDFNALIDNKQFFYQPVKKNKKHRKNSLKSQEMMTIQQEIY